VAAWYLTIFAGSLSAGLVGTLWNRMSHTAYFALLAGLAVIAAILLRMIDPWARRAAAGEPSA
jgi:POT family proton-dependent oligopeptide transporter